MSTIILLTIKIKNRIRPNMKTQLPKKQMRKMMRLKIVEYYLTQGRFAYEAGMDSGLLSRIINCTKDPTKKQAEKLSNLLKTSPKKLFAKSDAK